MMPLHITGGRVLLGDGTLAETALTLAGGVVAAIGGACPPQARAIDAAGKLVLPGMVDIHGDAFERQVMPRPNVSFPLDMALVDTDRQLIANGITTAFHGLTASWEPGLRSLGNARAFVADLVAARPGLAADNRLHVRWETFAAEAVGDVLGWLDMDPAPVLAFNDHTTATLPKLGDPAKVARWADRTGLSGDAYAALVRSVAACAHDVDANIDRLAAAARERGIIMLSHDDPDAAMRRTYRARGATVAEFPLTQDAAAEAVTHGEPVVLGGPNVVRGGSHTGALDAAAMVRTGTCSILASDYYYPAMAAAALRLAADIGIAAAWPLVSRNPARAAGLPDRGEIDVGRRADIIVVDAARGWAVPRIAAVVSAGHLRVEGM